MAVGEKKETIEENEPSRHASRWNLVRVLLDSDLLPIRELGLLDVERPERLVRTRWVLAHQRLSKVEETSSQLSSSAMDGQSRIKRNTKEKTHLSVLELLLHIVYRRPARLAHKAPKHQFRPDLARPRNCPADAHQMTDLLHPQLPNARRQRKVMEGDRELSGEEAKGC
jgi:hypothetical protein